MKKTKAEEVLVDEKTGAVRGVRVSSAQTRNAQTLSARAVVLATGGFANDREGSTSLLRQYAPETVRFATTNTRGTTGDGHKMAFQAGRPGRGPRERADPPDGVRRPRRPGGDDQDAGGGDSCAARGLCF